MDRLALCVCVGERKSCSQWPPKGAIFLNAQGMQTGERRRERSAARPIETHSINCRATEKVQSFICTAALVGSRERKRMLPVTSCCSRSHLMGTELGFPRRAWECQNADASRRPCWPGENPEEAAGWWEESPARWPRFYRAVQYTRMEHPSSPPAPCGCVPCPLSRQSAMREKHGQW